MVPSRGCSATNAPGPSDRHRPGAAERPRRGGARRSGRAARSWHCLRAHRATAVLGLRMRRAPSHSLDCSLYEPTRLSMAAWSTWAPATRLSSVSPPGDVTMMSHQCMANCLPEHRPIPYIFGRGPRRGATDAHHPCGGARSNCRARRSHPDAAPGHFSTGRPPPPRRRRAPPWTHGRSLPVARHLCACGGAKRAVYSDKPAARPATASSDSSRGSKHRPLCWIRGALERPLYCQQSVAPG
jgi:hypothetical protein